jgi:hypothetical protein
MSRRAALHLEEVIMRYCIVASAAVAAAIWATTPVSTSAQTWAVVDAVEVDRAVELEQRASVAMGNSREWSAAAAMYREASRLRSPNDPQALADLRTAGGIYGTVGDYRRARETILELADRATAFGEISVAAHAFLDAAHVAVALRDVPGAQAFYDRAQRLARSSHLSADEQGQLVRRLERTPTRFASTAN